jgi:hypothetical protein
VPVCRRAIAGLSPRDVRLREQRVYARAPLVVRVHLDASRIVVIPAKIASTIFGRSATFMLKVLGMRSSLPDGSLLAKPRAPAVWF